MKNAEFYTFMIFHAWKHLALTWESIFYEWKHIALIWESTFYVWKHLAPTWESIFHTWMYIALILESIFYVYSDFLRAEKAFWKNVKNYRRKVECILDEKILHIIQYVG